MATLDLTAREHDAATSTNAGSAVGARGAARCVGRRAAPMPTRCRLSAEHVATPGRSVASDDTGDAIVLNPANLAWLPGAELRWTWVYCPNDAAKVGLRPRVGGGDAAALRPRDGRCASTSCSRRGAARTARAWAFPIAGNDYDWAHLGARAQARRPARVRRVARALVLGQRLRRRPLRRHRRPLVAAQLALRVLGRRARLQPAEPRRSCPIGSATAAAATAGARRPLHARHVVPADGAPQRRRGARAPVPAGLRPVDPARDRWGSTCRTSGARSRASRRRTCQRPHRGVARHGRARGALRRARASAAARSSATASAATAPPASTSRVAIAGYTQPGIPSPDARRVDPPREHAVDARARRPPPAALAPRGGARRRRGDARPARRARELVRARRGAGRRHPRAARPRQEGPLLAGRTPGPRPSTRARAPTASSSTRPAACATRASRRSTSTSRACSTRSA